MMKVDWKLNFRRGLGVILITAGCLLTALAIALTRYDGVMIENTLIGLDSGELAFTKVAAIAGALMTDGYIRAVPVSVLLIMGLVAWFSVVVGSVLMLRYPVQKWNQWFTVSYWSRFS